MASPDLLCSGRFLNCDEGVVHGHHGCRGGGLPPCSLGQGEVRARTRYWPSRGRHGLADLELHRRPGAVRQRGSGRAAPRSDLRAHRAGLHPRLRHHRADQLRPRRPVHARLRVLLNHPGPVARRRHGRRQELGAHDPDARRSDVPLRRAQRHSRGRRL